MQVELTKKVDLLNKKGELNFKGYSKKMNFIYNRDNVKSFPLKLKEWNFYQFNTDKYVVQMTIGHVSYMSSVTLSVIDLETGVRKDIGSLKPFNVPSLDLNPEENSFVEYYDKNFYMSFKVQNDKRVLIFKGSNKIYHNVLAKIEMENDKNNEKLVIATPFKKKNQFYLNYKENYYNVKGFVKFDNEKISLDNASGLIDWGRGVWPYKHEWFWGNLTSKINNIPFGINIGWGFGNLENATENMFFYNRKAYKLKELNVQRDIKNYLVPWVIDDEEGKIHIEFTPIYDNYTENKYVVVNTHCNQVFGYYSGYIMVNEKKIEFNDILAFIEHVVNKW